MEWGIFTQCVKKQIILMNISLRPVLLKFKKYFVRSKVSTLEHHRNRDWKINVSFLILTVLLVLALDGYLFLQVNRGISEPRVISATKSVIALDNKALEETLSFFQNRARTFEMYRISEPEIADPGI